LPPPTITPNGGTFNQSIIVTVQAPDTNAAVYYTLNGALPTTSSPLYSIPLVLTNGAMLTANAFESNFDNSIAASALFIFQPLYFTTFGFTTNNSFQAGFLGAAGSNYVRQATTNFINWTPLTTNLGTTNQLNLVDPNATNFPYRFYRVLQQ